MLSSQQHVVSEGSFYPHILPSPPLRGICGYFLPPAGGGRKELCCGLGLWKTALNVHAFPGQGQNNHDFGLR